MAIAEQAITRLRVHSRHALDDTGNGAIVLELLEEREQLAAATRAYVEAKEAYDTIYQTHPAGASQEEKRRRVSDAEMRKIGAQADLVNLAIRLFA